MPQFVLKRRDLLGITMTGAAVLFWKPSKAKALGGKLPEIGEKAPGFDLPGTLGGGASKNWKLDNWAGRWPVSYTHLTLPTTD